MKRRDFLKFSGITSAALIAPTLINSSLTSLLPQEAGAKGKDPVEPRYSLPFRIIADPVGGVDLVSPMGAMFGTVPLHVLNRYPHNIDALCCADSSNTINEAEAKQRLSTGSILTSIPTAFQPIYTYALSAFSNSTEADLQRFNITGIVQPSENFRSQLQSNLIPNSLSPNWDVKGKVGDYFVRLSFEKHFIGGCVKRDAWHVGVLVRDLRVNRMRFDIHICSWWSGWRPCLAIYESVTRWCRNTCSWLFWDVIWAAIYAVGAAYMTAALAKALATFITAGAIGGLSLLPGVPPPP